MTNDNTVDRDPDLEKLVEGLKRQEQARRKKTLILVIVVVALATAVMTAALFFQDDIMGPAIDVQAGEEDLLEKTNDPQCRGFIDTVTAEGVAYRNMMAGLQANLLGDKPAETQTYIDDLDALRKRLDDARIKSVDAELRFPDSRQELDDWFKHIDKELDLLMRLGQEKLNPPAQSAFKKPPAELLDQAVLATHDAFENFRVWHTASQHPCGAASPDEKGWTP